MALEELEKKLYQKDEGQKPEEIPSREERKIPVEFPSPGQVWGKVPPRPNLLEKKFAFSAKTRKTLSFAAGFILVAIAGFFIFKFLYAPGEILITVQGPKEVKAGERQEYEITFENSSRSPLKDVVLTLRAGQGTAFAELEDQSVLQRTIEGELAPGSQRKEIVSVVFWGKPGEIREFSVSFRYLLGDLSTRFEEKKDVRAQIAQAAAELDLKLPDRAITEDEFSFSLEAKNLAAKTLTEAAVTLEASENFSLLESSPQAGDDGRWIVNLEEGKSVLISIKAKASGGEGEAKRVKAKFEVPVRGESISLAEVEESLGIVANPLVLGISLNGQKDYSVALGEELNYQITFKNNFEVPLRDVVLKARLESPLYSFSSLASNGAFSSQSQTITWHGGNTPQLLALNPQESGSVSFRIRLKNTFPSRKTENLLKLSLEISSPTKPPSLAGTNFVESREVHTAKVRGEMQVETSVSRSAVGTGFSNSGPFPPRVNQTTQYTARIKVTALGNDFRDIFTKTVLPNGVTFTGKIAGSTSGTEFLYNPRTNEIQWKIPELVGFESREIILQIALTPSLPQVNQSVPLLEAVEITGVDKFAGSEVRVQTQTILSAGVLQ